MIVKIGEHSDGEALQILVDGSSMDGQSYEIYKTLQFYFICQLFQV